MGTDYEEQISKYELVLDKLRQNPNMAAHVVSISKMVDDLKTNAINTRFNADTNLTLTQERAVDRFSLIRGGSISYLSHIAYGSLAESQTFTGLTEINFELLTLPKMLPIDLLCD
jgi:hypothetical protein